MYKENAPKFLDKTKPFRAFPLPVMLNVSIMKKKTKKIIQSVFVVIITILFSGAVWIYNDITQYYKAARFELTETLTITDEISTLESKVKKEEGTVLHFSDHDWMAILWIDNHGQGHPSTTVIRCSDNSWFYSHDHFLSSTGLWWEYLNIQLILNEKIEQNSPLSELEGIKSDLQDYWPYTVDQKPNLEEAQKHLVEMGFKPLKI